MKFKFLSSIFFGLLMIGAASAKADVEVGTIAVSPLGANGCNWIVTSSSGGYGPSFYTLNCPNDSGVVNIVNVNGTCNLSGSIKSGYKTVGTGCGSKVYRVEVVIPPPPAQCTSANAGKVYFTGPAYVAQNIMQTPQPQSFCGDCKVLINGSSGYYDTQTISCSTYKN